MTDLQQFFACYFHQDWLLMYSSDQEAIQEYLNDTEIGSIENAKGELDDILDEEMSEHQLEELIVSKYGCSYDPTQNSSNYKEWVSTIQECFSNHLMKHDSQKDH